MTESSEDSFLSRWSKRKLENSDRTSKEKLVIESSPQEIPDSGIAGAGETNGAFPAIAEVHDEQAPILTDADMPALESLDDESDFSCFMSSGVSDELRNLALRKLFSVPEFNFRDGLDDYDGDYTSFVELGDIITSDMKHRIEMEEKESLEEDADDLAAMDHQEDAQVQQEEEVQVDPVTADEGLAANERVRLTELDQGGNDPGLEQKNRSMVEKT